MSECRNRPLVCTSFSDIADTLSKFNAIGETEEAKYAWNIDGTVSSIDPINYKSQQILTAHVPTVHSSVTSIDKDFVMKLDYLNDAIEKLGISGIDLKSAEWGYNEASATSNNKNAELDKLSCDKFPGVILSKSKVCSMNGKVGGVK